jgi:hypothetical protein
MLAWDERIVARWPSACSNSFAFFIAIPVLPFGVVFRHPFV